ncbi:MAG: tRNA (guanosine(37)-N1)-methyltransferase TrmD [Acutalibacteraceae bacterium]|jgi:tRNA (guanine37-N1)-methyltransferase
MRIDILTLFPDLCDRVLSESVIGRARENGIIEVVCHNIRDYTTDKHRRVDDYPYGGGQGMILQADPIYRCYDAIREETGEKPHLIYLSPQGKTLTQQKARELATLPNLALLCGHYEGIDERVIEEIVDEELSIGDYVLTGGELPALVVADCVARMLPGVLADELCFTEESHFAGLLEYPQYSRPAEWHGRAVPPVLLSGDHKKVDAWRAEQALSRTKEKRPDLLKKERF